MEPETLRDWQRILTSAIVPGVSLLIGAGITYSVQRRLEDYRRGKAQRHFAYALLVQVAGAAARFEHSSRQLADLAPHFTEAEMAASDKFESADFWCAFVGEVLRKHEGLGQELDGFGPTLNAMSDYLGTTLSGLQIKGRDLADLPKEVVAAHQRASTSLSVVKQGLDGIVAIVQTDRAKVRDDVIRLTWTETQRMGQALVDLRDKLQVAAGVSADEVATLERDAIRNVQAEIAETTRRAQALPAAAAAVKEVLARRQAHQATTTNEQA